MKKKLTLSILIYFFTQFLFSETLIINDFDYIDLNIVSGEGGAKVLQLKQNEYEATPETDILLHFNGDFNDEAENYNVLSQYNNISSVETKLGSSSSYFLKDKGVTFSSNGESIFSPGRVIGDFTIEFWAYPTIISEDTIIFSWQGVNKVGSEFIPQRIKSYIENRTTIWEFQNLFIPEDFSKFTVKLVGNSRLIPNVWNHYLLRYNSSTGLIEFLLNGVPEGITYSTSTGKEDFIVYPPYIGQFSKSEIYLGENFRGFIDEFRISEEFIKKPTLSKFKPFGTFLTPVYDMNGDMVELEKILPNDNILNETTIRYQYRISDDPFIKENRTIPWLDLNDLSENKFGRYIQIQGVLYSNGNQSKTPTVNDIEVSWNNIPKPPAPKLIISKPGEQSLTVEWQPIKHFNIDGYYLYYGKQNNNYIEMIDVGNETSYTIEGLKSDNIYYFSIRSYKDNRMSDYSIEKYDRPN